MLVLDEADKLLDLGFMYELKEIIKSISPQHQTLLFSATLTGKVSELIELALRKPIRVSANPDFQIAKKLRQEFATVTWGERYSREATLLTLTEEFKKKVIVFFKTKHNCHRVAILLGLLGKRCKELHGNLTQTERIEALEHFRDNKVDFLLSTDLAARGIDIKQVKYCDIIQSLTFLRLKLLLIMNYQLSLPSISIESEELLELVNLVFPSLFVMIEKRIS